MLSGLETMAYGEGFSTLTPQTAVSFDELQHSAGLKAKIYENFEITLEQIYIMTRKLHIKSCNTVF